MSRHQSPWIFGLALIVSAVLAIPFWSTDSASAQSSSIQAANGLSISVNMTSVSLTEGDYFSFSTEISNNGIATTSSLVVHLNVASLVEGVYVDPEDWSSQRTIFLDSLAPGASVNQSWRIHALFAGDVAVYVVVLPMDSALIPVASKEVIVHVEKWSVMRPSDVTPVIILVPVLIGTLYVGNRYRIALRRRLHARRSGPR